jgi:ribosomal-protein-alanine N-acetyltransferase
MKHVGTKTIETDRLILRRVTSEDARAMYRNWASDPEVTKYLTWPAYTAPEDAQGILKIWEKDYEKADFYLWAIVPGDLGEPIGTISVVEMNETAQWLEIGYCIGRNWWNKGYVSEALKAVIAFFFEEVGAGRIQARHDPRNVHSGAVMRKCGMTFEGILRRADRNNQGICDAAIYSILREEYDRQHHLLCELNDEKLLGTDAVSTNWPRLAARAVVRNRAGRIGLTYIAEFDLHNLPGGGVEAGESPEDTVRREVREETGCTCGKITPLGIVYENRGSQNFVQQSWYYAVEAEEDDLPLMLTEKEAANGTCVHWVTVEEAIRRIESQDVTMDSRKFVRARDLAALEAWRRDYDK